MRLSIYHLPAHAHKTAPSRFSQTVTMEVPEGGQQRSRRSPSHRRHRRSRDIRLGLMVALALASKGAGALQLRPFSSSSSIAGAACQRSRPSPLIPRGGSGRSWGLSRLLGRDGDGLSSAKGLAELARPRGVAAGRRCTRLTQPRVRALATRGRSHARV